jgi:hypothetical protein
LQGEKVQQQPKRPQKQTEQDDVVLISLSPSVSFIWQLAAAFFYSYSDVI